MTEKTLYLDAAAVRRALDWGPLIDALDAMFRVGGCEAPPRHHHAVPRAGQPEATLLLMPAWTPAETVAQDGAIGVKLVSVFPGNAARGRPAITGLYVVFDAETGALRAVLDGTELTARRTAAASALAARYLARADAKRLLIVGTGRLSGELAAAHAAVRPIERVAVWGRSHEKAAAAAARIETALGIPAAAAPAGPDGLDQAVSEADLVSAATLSEAPLIRGAALQPGTHVDLVGAFKPTMRETDDAVMARADAVVVDTYAGALVEGGDVVQALASGALTRARIRAELAELAGAGTAYARPGLVGSEADAITVFKSVGASLEDLAAALLCLKRGPSQAS